MISIPGMLCGTFCARGIFIVSFLRFSIGKNVAPICWVMPPASPSYSRRTQSSDDRRQTTDTLFHTGKVGGTPAHSWTESYRALWSFPYRHGPAHTQSANEDDPASWPLEQLQIPAATERAKEFRVAFRQRAFVAVAHSLSLQSRGFYTPVVCVHGVIAGVRVAGRQLFLF